MKKVISAVLFHAERVLGRASRGDLSALGPTGLIRILTGVVLSSSRGPSGRVTADRAKKRQPSSQRSRRLLTLPGFAFMTFISLKLFKRR